MLVLNKDEAGTGPRTGPRPTPVDSSELGLCQEIVEGKTTRQMTLESDLCLFAYFWAAQAGPELSMFLKVTVNFDLPALPPQDMWTISAGRELRAF